MSAEITAWLDEAQATADAATEGPWSARESVDGFSSSVHSPRGCVAVMRSTPSRELRTDELGPYREGHRHDDAAFIADARTRLPQAIAALRAVLAHMDNIEAVGGYEHLAYRAIREVIAEALAVQP